MGSSDMAMDKFNQQELVNKPYRLPTSRIISLLLVFILAMSAIVAIDILFNQLTQSLTEKLQNERSRVLIGESIIQDVQHTELYVYQMATSSGNLAYKHYEKKIQQAVDQIYQKLAVLKEGGQITRTIFLNIEEQDEIQQTIKFQHQEEDISYQLVELEVIPQLKQILDKAEKLKRIVAERNDAIGAVDLVSYTQVLHRFIKHFPPLFFRLYENIGRLHYTSQKNTERLELDLSEQLAFYTKTRYLLIFAIILFVSLFGYLFVRRVIHSNRQVDQTWYAMEQAKASAEQASVAKSQFLSNMSHELRTPLNAIIGFAQLLNMEKLPPTQSQPVDHIHKSAIHLLEMVSQILDLSKIEAGTLQISSEPFSLHKLLDDTCQVLKSSIEEKGLLFHFHREADVASFVKGDELRIRQVLLNLLANAVKFTHVGSISLTVSNTKEDNLLYFEIADTGIGMTEETLKKLFHTFTQADISSSKRYGGAGLGLSLSKELIELMGGSIGAHSTQNEGSRFWFTLPLVKTDPVRIYQLGELELVDHGSDFSQLRVLLVEDNPVNQMVAVKMLKKAGIIPDTAIHGQEALEKLATSQYDLIFLDVQMPIMDGYETIKKIRADEKDNTPQCRLYVIGLSANALNEDKEKALSLGMDDYLTKPVNFAELKQKLELVWTKTKECSYSNEG